MRKKERIDYLAGCLDRIIDWAHARGGDYEAMTDTTLQCMQETLDERNDLRRDKERLSAELARATTKSEYEAAWETVRLEFGVKDKPIGPERAAMEVRSIVRERMEETVSLRAKVSELQSDNEVLRDLRDTVHDVVIGASTALRHEFGVAAGPLPDVVEGACESHRRVSDALATERNTTARLTEELAHARGQLEAAMSSNATLSEDMTRMRETDEIWGRLYEGMVARLGRAFGFDTEGGVLEEAVDQACAAFVEVTKGLNGLGAELAAPLGTPLAEVTVLARAHIVTLNDTATKMRAKVEELEGECQAGREANAQAMAKLRTFLDFESSRGDTLQSIVDLVCARGAGASVRKVFMHVADVLGVFKAQPIDVVASDVQGRLGNLKEADVMSLIQAVYAHEHLPTLAMVLRDARKIVEGKQDEAHLSATVAERLRTLGDTLGVPGTRDLLEVVMAAERRLATSRGIDPVSSPDGRTGPRLPARVAWTPRQGDLLVSDEGVTGVVLSVRSDGLFEVMLGKDRTAIETEETVATSCVRHRLRMADQVRRNPAAWRPSVGDVILDAAGCIAHVMEVDERVEHGRDSVLVRVKFESGGESTATTSWYQIDRANALEAGLRDLDADEMPQPPRAIPPKDVAVDPEQWRPLVNDTVVDGSGVEGRVTEVADKDMFYVDWAGGSNVRHSLPLALLRSWRKHFILRQREAAEGPFYGISLGDKVALALSSSEGHVIAFRREDGMSLVEVLWNDGHTYRHDPPSVREWKNYASERTRVNAAEVKAQEPPPDAPSAPEVTHRAVAGYEWAPREGERVVDHRGGEGTITEVYQCIPYSTVRWAGGHTAIHSNDRLLLWIEDDAAFRRGCEQQEEPAPEGWSPFVGDRVAVGGWPRVYAGDHEGLGDLCYVAADLAEGTGRIVVQKAVLRPWAAGRARTAPASGQQHQDVSSIGAFDALGKENTRLRRKLERVFEALKDTPTEAP